MSDIVSCFYSKGSSRVCEAGLKPQLQKVARAFAPGCLPNSKAICKPFLGRNDLGGAIANDSKQTNPNERDIARFVHLADRAELECALRHIAHAKKFIATAWLVHDAIERRGPVFNDRRFQAASKQLQEAEHAISRLLQGEAGKAA